MKKLMVLILFVLVLLMAAASVDSQCRPAVACVRPVYLTQRPRPTVTVTPTKTPTTVRPVQPFPF